MRCFPDSRCTSEVPNFWLNLRAGVSNLLKQTFVAFVLQHRDPATMETTGVSGHHGVNGVLVASLVTKGDSLGIDPVFLLLNALIVKDMKSKLVILTNA